VLQKNAVGKEVAAHDVKKAIAQAVNEYNATENLLRNYTAAPTS
jgi:hypothetical protein